MRRPNIFLTEREEDRLWKLYERGDIIGLARGRDYREARIALQRTIRGIFVDLRPSRRYAISTHLIAIFTNTE